MDLLELTKQAGLTLELTYDGAWRCGFRSAVLLHEDGYSTGLPARGESPAEAVEAFVSMIRDKKVRHDIGMDLDVITVPATLTVPDLLKVLA